MNRRIFLLASFLAAAVTLPQSRADLPRTFGQPAFGPSLPPIASRTSNASPASRSKKAARFDPRATQAQTAALAAASPTFRRVRTGGTILPEWLRPPTDPYRLGAGDRLEIEMMEFPETRQMCMVLPDGTLYFHTLSGLKVNGLSLEELRPAMEKALAQDYRNPRVSIILRAATNRKIWIMGRCKRPGVYPLEGPTTVLEALGRAGGFEVARSLGDSEEIVDLQHSFLIRNGQFVPIDFNRLVREGDAGENIYLQDNDYIYLPAGSGARAYVLGAVNQPRVVDFREHMTLSAAISNAGGFARGAYPQRVMLVRDSLTNPQVAVINMKDIAQGKATDVALEPKDIIWVPNSPFERLEGYLGQVVSTFARTIAVNEGARVATPSAQPVGVNLNIGGGAVSSGTVTGPAQNTEAQSIGAPQ